MLQEQKTEWEKQFKPAGHVAPPPQHIIWPKNPIAALLHKFQEPNYKRDTGMTFSLHYLVQLQGGDTAFIHMIMSQVCTHPGNQKVE